MQAFRILQNSLTSWLPVHPVFDEAPHEILHTLAVAGYWTEQIFLFNFFWEGGVRELLNVRNEHLITNERWGVGAIVLTYSLVPCITCYSSWGHESYKVMDTMLIFEL